jgi:hypothetical protein
MTFQSRSQAQQDLFVWNILQNKTDGLFLDIGSHDPVYINNTYELEQKKGWRGYLFDIDRKWAAPTAARRASPFVCADLTTFDWTSFIHSKGISGKRFDYMSFDIDRASLLAVRRFPFNEISFSIATVEHDSYRFGEAVATEMRELFGRNGYDILCKDVKLNGIPYEDWYVHTSLLEQTPEIERFRCEGLEYSEILKKL